MVGTKGKKTKTVFELDRFKSFEIWVALPTKEVKGSDFKKITLIPTWQI